jgi:hypothetical protein
VPRVHQLQPGDRVYFVDGCGFRVSDNDRAPMLAAMAARLVHAPGLATVLVINDTRHSTHAGSGPDHWRRLVRAMPTLKPLPVMTEDEVRAQAATRKRLRRQQLHARERECLVAQAALFDGWRVPAGPRI